VLRDAAFAAQFPRYPAGRYAPERELLREGSERIYVTLDAPAEVLRFYETNAQSGGYKVTRDDDADHSGLLLLERGSTTLFLTATKEEGVTVLYFSDHGEMRTIVRPVK
jgi:hypothetical protein